MAVREGEGKAGEVRDAGWTRIPGAGVLSEPASAVVLRLTLLVLMLHGASGVGLEVLLVVLCGAMLVFPTLLESRVMWVAVCGCVWWLNAADWLWIDNHKFLMSYWCLACALAVQSGRPGAVLRHNAAALLGLSFLFAVVWKVVGGEYSDGSFFYFTLRTDLRFEMLGRLSGMGDSAVLGAGVALVDALREFPEAGAVVSLTGDAGYWRMAVAVSVWTLAIEGAVAGAFLLRVGRRGNPGVVGDVCLVVFVATTYAFIPVMGFGNLLALLGLAACPEGRRKTRAVYLSLLGILQLAQLPWAMWVG